MFLRLCLISFIALFPNSLKRIVIVVRADANTIDNTSNETMIPYKIEALPNSYTEVGKGPQWDHVSQSLYYVDVDTGKLLRYDYKQKKVYKCKLEEEDLVVFIEPIEGSPNEFAVGCLPRAIIVNWDGISETCNVVRTLFEVQPGDKFKNNRDGISETCNVVRTLFEVQPGDKFKNNRFNDGKTYPSGRLIAGTMKYGDNEFHERLGELYSYSKGGKVDVVKTDKTQIK